MTLVSLYIDCVYCLCLGIMVRALIGLTLNITVDLPILRILLKLWGSTRRQSKGCEVQEVSNSERRTIPITMVVKSTKHRWRCSTK